MRCQKLPSESCDGDRTDDDFILGEALLKPMPICFPPGAVDRYPSMFLEDDDVVMRRHSLDGGAALGGRGCESGDAAEPVCQLFLEDMRVLCSGVKGRPSLSATGNRISTDARVRPSQPWCKRDGVAHHLHWRDAVLPDVAGLPLTSDKATAALLGVYSAPNRLQSCDETGTCKPRAGTGRKPDRSGVCRDASQFRRRRHIR